jgi:hypothetical protein
MRRLERRGAFQCRVPVLRFLQSIHVGKSSCGSLRSTLIVKFDGEEEVEMPEDLTLRMPIKCLNPAQRLRSWGTLGGVAVKSWQSSREAYLTSSLRLASESELDKYTVCGHKNSTGLRATGKYAAHRCHGKLTNARR